VTGRNRKPIPETWAGRLSAALASLRRWTGEAFAVGRLGWLNRLWPEFLQEALARRGWAPTTRVLGLDLDGDRVFAVELHRRKGVVLVERAEQFPLPPETSGQPSGPGKPAGGRGLRPDGETRGPGAAVDSALAKRVVEELDRRGFRARDLATVISREHTFQRTLHLPPATPEELEAMAVLKSERELPLAAEEARTDFLFLPRSQGEPTAWPPPPDDEEGHLVVVCAAATAAVAEATRGWAEAGLEPRALDVVGQSAFRALRAHWQRGEGLVCLLLVREAAVELVIGGEVPLFTRAVFPGGSVLAGDGGEATAQVAREVVRSLRSFSAEFPDERVSEVVLVSRHALDRAALEQATGLPVRVPEGIPRDEVEFQGPEVADLAHRRLAGRRVAHRRIEALGPEFAPALGVAWQELTGERERVNFLTPWKARRQRAERYRRVQMAVVASALALLVVLMPVGVLAVRGARLALVEKELAALGPRVRGLEEVKSWLELARPWTSQRSLPLKVLGELTEVATAEVYLRTASISTTGTVTLEGYATGPGAAYDVRDRLAQRTGVLTDVTYVKGYTGKDARFSHEFTLTAQVHGWSVEPRSRRRR